MSIKMTNITKITIIFNIITYTLAMTFTVKNGSNICIPAFTLSALYSQIESSQTVVAQSTNPDIESRLMEDIIEQFYERITSKDTNQLLNQSACKVQHTQ